MGYIWEKYSKENKFLVKEGERSSFVESYEISNDSDKAKSFIVNLALRFSSIFSFDKNDELLSEFSDNNSSLTQERHCELSNDSVAIQKNYEELINIITHYLAQRDIINGTYYTDTYLLIIQDEIKKGAYGEEAKERYSKLSDIDKRLILKYIELKHNQKNLKYLFSSVFMDMFGRINNMFNEKTEWDSSYTEHSAEIYYNNYKNTFYYFCAAEKTEKNENRFELAKLLFADCRKNIVPIWGKYCFGVIDEYFPKEAAIPVIDGIQIL